VVPDRGIKMETNLYCIEFQDIKVYTTRHIIIRAKNSLEAENLFKESTFAESCARDSFHIFVCEEL